MRSLGQIGLKIINVGLVAGMVVMSALVLTNVILRYGFHSGLPFSVEISRLIFVWIVLVGAVAVMAEGQHLAVTMLTAALPEPARRPLALLTHGVMLYCCYLIAKGSYSLVLINWNNRSPISGVSVGFLYGAGLFFALGCALVLLVGIFNVLTGREPVPVQQGMEEAGQ